MDWFCWENCDRKPMGFYHQIDRAFRLTFSHHPIHCSWDLQISLSHRAWKSLIQITQTWRPCDHSVPRPMDQWSWWIFPALQSDQGLWLDPGRIQRSSMWPRHRMEHLMAFHGVSHQKWWFASGPVEIWRTCWWMAFFSVAIAFMSASVSFKYNGNITYINALIQWLGIYSYILFVINIIYIYIYPFNHWTSLIIYECFHRCHRVTDMPWPGNLLDAMRREAETRGATAPNRVDQLRSPRNHPKQLEEGMKMGKKTLKTSELIGIDNVYFPFHFPNDAQSVCVIEVPFTCP